MTNGDIQHVAFVYFQRRQVEEVLVVADAAPLGTPLLVDEAAGERVATLGSSVFLNYRLFAVLRQSLFDNEVQSREGIVGADAQTYLFNVLSCSGNWPDAERQCVILLPTGNRCMLVVVVDGMSLATSQGQNRYARAYI